jgi:hypothetical protein
MPDPTLKDRLRARLTSVGPWISRRRWLAWTAGGVAGVIALMVLALALVDWNLARGPIGRFASARLHREVVIAGPLEVHPWSLKPWARARDIRVGDPAWAGAGHTADIEGLTVQIKLLPLLRGQLVLLRLEADRPDLRLRRDLQGRATWDFSGGKPSAKPFRMPPVRSFIVRDGKLQIIDDQRKLAFNGVIAATEQLGQAARGFQLSGEGQLNGNPFELRVTGGPLLNVRADRPYPFDAHVRSGATRISAKGAIPRPFDLARFSLDLDAKGPDLADLYDLTGVALPNTPPYHLTGRLQRREKVYALDQIRGRVGDSDLAGKISVETGRTRPFLKADLSSRSLDFDDLAALFGGAPGRTRGETVSAAQQAVGRQMAAQRRLLPDTTLNVIRIRSLDADVRYRAASIRAPNLPLKSAAVHVKLDAGLLTADPVAFDLTRGRVAGRAQLNARKATPVTTVDLRITGARLEQFIPVAGAPISGAVVARVKLSGAGDSVHRAAANADGQVVVASSGGEIREAFAELLGVNVIKGLGLLWSKDKSAVPIRCAVADFQATRGRLTASNIVFDTEPVLATGSGQVDLGQERLDFRLQGHSKKPRLVRALVPITVKGPVLSPKVGVETGKVAVQGGLAGILASAVTPLAVILPFIDPGLAKDAACGALIADARREGAPRR